MAFLAIEERLRQLESKNTELATTLRSVQTALDEATARSVPTGVIEAYGGSTGSSIEPIAGWLRCRGEAVSRTTYAALYARIGTTFGAGDGSTTFNLPNLQGRVPVGYDSTQTEFDAIGETGGRKTTAHAYYVAPINSGSMQVGGSNYEGAVLAQINAYLTANGGTAATTAAVVQNYGGGISGSGTGATEVRHHRYTAPNLQPYLTVNFIIKS